MGERSARPGEDIGDFCCGVKKPGFGVPVPKLDRSRLADRREETGGVLAVGMDKPENDC